MLPCSAFCTSCRASSAESRARMKQSTAPPISRRSAQPQPTDDKAMERARCSLCSSCARGGALVSAAHGAEAALAPALAPASMLANMTRNASSACASACSGSRIRRLRSDMIPRIDARRCSDAVVAPGASAAAGIARTWRCSASSAESSFPARTRASTCEKSPRTAIVRRRAVLQRRAARLSPTPNQIADRFAAGILRTEHALTDHTSN